MGRLYTRSSPALRVDAHAHLVPESLLRLAAEEGKVHGLGVSRGPDGAFQARLSDGSTRTVPPGLSDLEMRWQRMSDQAVDLQVVSGWNEFLGYELPRNDGRWWARAQNEHLAAVVADHSRRLAGLAVVPLQRVDDAIDEARYATASLGLVGVTINTNVNGRNLDSPELAPFWAALAELDAPLVVHPSTAGAIGADRLSQHMLAIALGNPAETTIAAACLMRAGVLREFGLRVLLVHGGGFLPYQWGRLRKSFEILHGRDAGFPVIESSLGEFLFDSLLHDEGALELLVEQAGPSRVLFGTDYPFEMRETRPADEVFRSRAATPEAVDALAGENAVAFYGLQDRARAHDVERWLGP